VCDPPGEPASPGGKKESGKAPLLGTDPDLGTGKALAIAGNRSACLLSSPELVASTILTIRDRAASLRPESSMGSLQRWQTQPGRRGGRPSAQPPTTVIRESARATT